LEAGVLSIYSLAWMAVTGMLCALFKVRRTRTLTPVRYLLLFVVTVGCLSSLGDVYLYRNCYMR